MQALAFDLIDKIGLIGSAVGIIIAIWLQDRHHEPPRHYLPFIGLSIVFAMFAGEGGALDPFGPGTLRAAALMLLLAIELFGAFVVATNEPGETLFD